MNQHQEKLRSEQLNETKENLPDKFINTLGLSKKGSDKCVSILSPLSLKIYIPQTIQRQNYILFSLTVIYREGTTVVIGIGISDSAILSLFR